MSIRKLVCNIILNDNVNLLRIVSKSLYFCNSFICKIFFFHWTFLYFSFIDKAVCVFCNMLWMAICVIIRNYTSVAHLVMCLIRNRRNRLSSLHRPYIQSRHMVQTCIQSMLSTSDQKSAHKFCNIDVIYYKLLVMKNEQHATCVYAKKLLYCL